MSITEPSSATAVAPAPAPSERKRNVKVRYQQYRDERDLPTVMDLIDNELSEPYSIFTYRYFLHNWPQLAFLAYDGDHCFGTVVCKMDVHREQMLRGYLAMLVVEKPYRSLGTGTELVKLTIAEMIKGQCEEVVLEAEVTNSGALALYQNLGFVRDKRLHRYYLNGVDAFRLKLLLPITQQRQEMMAAEELRQMSLNSGEGTAGDQNPTDSPPGAAAGQDQNPAGQNPAEQYQKVHVNSSVSEAPNASNSARDEAKQSQQESELIERLEALRT